MFEVLFTLSSVALQCQSYAIFTKILAAFPLPLYMKKVEEKECIWKCSRLHFINFSQKTLRWHKLMSLRTLRNVILWDLDLQEDRFVILPLIKGFFNPILHHCNPRVVGMSEFCTLLAWPHFFPRLPWNFLMLLKEPHLRALSNGCTVSSCLASLCFKSRDKCLWAELVTSSNGVE